MNCHLAITRVKFVYLIDACVLRRKLNRRFIINEEGMAHVPDTARAMSTFESKGLFLCGMW